MTTPPTPTQAKTREEWRATLRDLTNASDNMRICTGTDHESEAARVYRYAMHSATDSIMSLQASETKIQAENQDLRAEVERLVRIKREWDALIEPLLDFGRDNAEHLDLRVGDCIITKALGLMEEKVKRGRR